MRGLTTRVRDYEYPGQFPPGRETPMLPAPPTSSKSTGMTMLLLAALGAFIIPVAKKRR